MNTLELMACFLLERKAWGLIIFKLVVCTRERLLNRNTDRSIGNQPPHTFLLALIVLSQLLLAISGNALMYPFGKPVFVIAFCPHTFNMSSFILCKITSLKKKSHFSNVYLDVCGSHRFMKNRQIVLSGWRRAL